MGMLIDAVMGFAVGDALGVPVKNFDRKRLEANPVTDMTGYGVYDLPPGSWADNTSLLLCMCDSIRVKKDINYNDIMKRFKRWLKTGQYTPYGEAFGASMVINKVLRHNGKNPFEGSTIILSNSNGSLKYILPLVFWPYAEAQKTVFKVCSLTHDNLINKIACDLYVQIAIELMLINDPERAIQQSCRLYKGDSIFNAKFKRLPDIHTLERSAIQSTYYVVDTLEAVLWCLLTTDNYKDCVLQAVNLGGDTNTVAALAGGLAGILYGMYKIPDNWVSELANKELIHSCLF